MTEIAVIATMLGLNIAIIAWDVYLYRDKIPGNSITQVIIKLSKDKPIIPAAIGAEMGFLFGHWFTWHWCLI